MRIIIIKRKTILFAVLVLFLISIIFFFLSRKSVNTFKIFDPIYKGSEAEKKVAFACNVVWGNEYLPDMLSEFKKNNIRITFFIGGDWADKNKELLMRIHADNHEIGNHGYNHLKHTQISEEKNREEIIKTEEVINNIIGVKTELFAPPYGDVNKKVAQIAESLGYKVIMWSIDTIDWNTKDYTKILERVNKKIHNGAIILMHPTESTVKALPIMISNLMNNDYNIVPVSEVLENNN
ncbi:polysaccharide deacetylase family protein [Lutispora thermophila]|uniref:Probable sporulation protein, polysaccharide deacetylase family n=1 Tax=Lutispora thermophila DSM 19022 TaxID=1122184 RepID=A0A1M6I5D0_9FIRM|nr:polysaccharide deacetylase family protein [Lutispora thermophila]SHJ29651.1 probable sporulation protein, polysaccharide deacetylase family [Lutispora thermophila DSM 19022]